MNTFTTIEGHNTCGKRDESQSENMAIKAWVLNTGNVIDVNQTEGCLTKLKSGFEGRDMMCDFNKCVGR